MSRSKINFNSKTKLSNFINKDYKEIEPHKKLDIISHHQPSQPISFRMRTIDMERMNELLKNVNECNKSQPFNKSTLLRGILMYAFEADPNKILNFIRKSI